MSAVAQELEGPLARWISGDTESQPVISDYRSTRQLVGRLLCRPTRTTLIEYDVLDGEPLEVRGLEDEAAYVPQPFPPHPPAPTFTGPKKGMAPFTLWAALQLAAVDHSGSGQSVLISVVEGIANFTGWCISLLEEDWSHLELPAFFEEPPEGSEERQLWDLALTMTDDLFGRDSREFRLLRNGIVVHHGRMPGRLPRLLVELVERRIVRVVVATSTLTQGVNLPFETILIPGLTRQSGRLSAQEFANLIGRAGRPGVATEGQALVLLLEGLPRWQRVRAETDYRATLADWIRGRPASGESRSPLAALINLIWDRWPGMDPDAFEAWLEMTAVADRGAEEDPLLRALDALDGVLLASLEETEADVEEGLRQVWSETFARYASAEEARLERAFLSRGAAVSRRFRDPEERHRIYRTSLPPRDAQNLYGAAPALMEHLRSSTAYWTWNPEQRLSFIENAIELVSQVRRFAIPQTVGNSRATWREVLRWWLYPSSASRQPSVAQVGIWHDFIAQWFAYRFAWGLAAMTLLSVPANSELTPDIWSLADIPPAALWIKDLVTWGTLEPVAAYALSRRLADARPDAESLASSYYEQVDIGDARDPLEPMLLRAWAASLGMERRSEPELRIPLRIGVELNPRIADPATFGRWRVLPILKNDRMDWVDMAGYILATSAPLTEWDAEMLRQYDFMLNAVEHVIESARYL